MLVSAASIRTRVVQLAVAAALLLGVTWLLLLPSSPYHHRLASHLGLPRVPAPAAAIATAAATATPTAPRRPRPNHPIDQLTRTAEAEHDAILAEEARHVHAAAEAYRARRGRQPPPRFDVWFQFARNNSAVTVERFFDRIYDDLDPFWGVPAKQMREQAHAFIHRISVRSGHATGRTDIERREWIELWKDMVQSVAPWLPDVDLPINVMDESRIVVPFEDMAGYMAKAKASRRIVAANELKTSFGDLRDLDKHAPPPFDPVFVGEGPYWSLAVVGCPPDSPARKAYIETDFTRPPPLSTEPPANTFHGYVKNWTFARDPCEHPSLQGLHGTFVEPISIANSRQLFPLFGGSKLPMNNEILLPPAMYWTQDPFYSGGDDHGGAWEEKKDRLIWRGSASGGRNRAENWTRFQRHRFVAMVNATSIGQYEHHHHHHADAKKPPNFVLPAANGTYDLAVQRPEAPATAFGDWVREWSDAAVVHLLCFPPADGEAATCPYTDPYFSVAPAMPMGEQYAHKYLADVDGNSFSGRYRGFLGSTSLPVKATIYHEWHDSRLVPWKHFVPMDNTFLDIYGLMEYFVGNRRMAVPGHDPVARKMALDGKAWAEKVLRREDMSVYVFRLLLEFARLCDEEREVMGWAEGT